MKTIGLSMHNALLLLSAAAAKEETLKCASIDLDAVVCSDSSKPRVWIQIAKVGQWAGHPAGPFQLNAQVFAEIVHNFKSTQNRQIPIDYEHASEAECTDGSIPSEGAPAQGWIHDLDNRGSQGLWGLVSWGDRARSQIKAGEYKFFSPAIRFGARDRVTGKPIGARLTSGALTNQPFLDGMAELVAARDAAVKLDDFGGDGGDISEGTKAGGSSMMSAHQFMPQLKAMMGMHPFAPPHECKAAVEALRDMHNMTGNKPGAVCYGVNLDDYTGKMRDMLRLPMTSSAHDVLDAVQTMIHSAIVQHEAEYHSQQINQSDRVATEGETMDPKELLLKIAKLEADAIASKTAHEAAVATLNLELKDAKASAEKAATENKALLADKEKAEDVARGIEVETAFAVYKDAKNLSDSDKSDMLLVLKATPDAFRRMYPKVAAGQEDLQRSITAGDKNGPGSLKNVTGGKLSLSDHMAQALKDPANKGKSYAQIQNIVAIERGVAVR